MFPRHLLLSVADEGEFQRYKSHLAWLLARLSARVTLLNSKPVGKKPTLGADPQEGSRSAEVSHLVDDAVLGEHTEGFLEVSSGGTLPDVIFDSAERIGADLVVMPTHGRSGFDRLISGSVTERVVRACRMPVLTLDIPDEADSLEQAACGRCIVPTDFSKFSKKAAFVAADIASRIGCGVTLFHAVEPHPYAATLGGGYASLDYSVDMTKVLQPHLESIADTMRSRGADVDVKLVAGPFVYSIEEYCSQYRNPLVIMATTGRDSLESLFIGSSTERVLRTSLFNVLALPGSSLTKLDPSQGDS
ncbi:MAG: universal stress protein [Planctomycetota bacterium]